MTEKEKMLSGQLYNANKDESLVQELLRCKDLCFQYNHLMPSDLDKRTALLKKLLGKIHGGFYIEPDFWCDYGYNIEIGDGFYSNHNLVILDCVKVTFGKHVYLGPNCGFYTSGHPLDVQTRISGLEYGSPITIGDHVWFGGNVAVMPGVTVGSDTVIGAGSVVTRDIPAGVIAVGNPCRVLRSITDEDKFKD